MCRLREPNEKKPHSRMKTIFHAQIISNLLVISSFLAVTTSCQSANSSSSAKNETTPPILTQSRRIEPPPIVDTADSATTTTLATSSQLKGRQLIGSILLRAAHLSSLNQDQQQELQHYATTEESGQYDDSIDERPSNQQVSVPTDSGEDPLESSTTLTTTITANDHDGDNDNDSDNDNDNDDRSHPLSVGQQQAPTPSGAVTEADSGELAVDSNNVSAIILSSSAIKQSSPPQVAAELANKQVMSCEQAYTQCALRKACAPALKAYNDHCHELISNQTNECSPKCLDAMIALRSSEEGADLANCDCQSNDYCMASKVRSQLCKAQVDKSLDPKTVVSCSTASWICMADQSCAPALGFYYRNCRSLLSQRHCSARCNNSLTVLHRQPKALKLISCQCDGSEDFPCLRLKTFTEQLCLNKQAAAAASSLSIMGNDQLTTEEESSNLTNNPENFVLGVPVAASSRDPSAAAASAGAGYTSGDNADDNNREEAAGEESSFNGIQLTEDNWIPLISGRYFTNLHHQQQQLQPLEAQQSKQRQKLKEQNQHKQQQQQQTRRVQRNMRQQKARSANATHHEGGKRSRFVKIFMLAASTSSASSSVSLMTNPYSMTLLTWTLVGALASLVGRTGRPCC